MEARSRRGVRAHAVRVIRGGTADVIAVERARYAFKMRLGCRLSCDRKHLRKFTRGTVKEHV